MTNVKQTKNISDFFISFLKRVSEDGEIQLEEALEEWKSKENQVKLTKLIKKTDKKPRKDPTKPKRGKSSYIFFCQDQRSTAKANLTNPTSPQVTSELAKMWRKLKSRDDDDAKTQMDRYIKESESDKERYKKEMCNYVPQDMTKKVKKDPTKPKRSKSSYIFFCSRHREEVKSDLSDSTATEVVRELGRLWGKLKIDESELGRNEMAELTKLAVQDKKRFVKELEKYNTKSETEIVTKVETKVETKVGDFKIFAVAMRSDFKVRFPTLKASQITAKMGKEWRELSEEDKQKWAK